MRESMLTKQDNLMKQLTARKDWRTKPLAFRVNLLIAHLSAFFKSAKDGRVALHC